MSVDGTINTYTGGGSVELRRRIVENKPEFDGRFFVKIKRDSQLEQSLIKKEQNKIIEIYLLLRTRVIMVLKIKKDNN